MNSQTFIQLAQLGTILIGLLGVAVSLRSHRRQMYAQMYIEFSARFHHVLRTFPAQIWMEAVAEGEPLPSRHEELTKSCLQCFHIIADLYHLHQGGYIPPALWRPWQRGITRAMRRPLLRREWRALEGNFDHDTELCHYMRRLVIEASAGAKHSGSSGDTPANSLTTAASYRKLLSSKSRWPHSVRGGNEAAGTGDTL
jgi:hypothetical protein